MIFIIVNLFQSVWRGFGYDFHGGKLNEENIRLEIQWRNFVNLETSEVKDQVVESNFRYD